MKVLLISAVAGLDPPCGDITYTETLMKNPPPGVSYETYDQALKRGALVERTRQPSSASDFVLRVINKCINLLRQAGILYREPFRFFRVAPGEYDLIHAHVFNVHFEKLYCPLVMSSGAPLCDVYRNRWRTLEGRINAMESIDRFLAKLMKVNCFSHFMPQMNACMVYTEYFRNQLLRICKYNESDIIVVPLFLPPQSVPLAADDRKPKRIGFVANNFHEKGGDVLLAAYRKVKQVDQDAELWIVGSKPVLSNSAMAELKITWLTHVNREELLNQIMPSFDVFAFPTPQDNFSYVLIEAMSRGIAIATSDYISMPEAVDFGRAGLISKVGDAEALAANILQLLQPDDCKTFKRAAHKRFQEFFSSDKVYPLVLSAYKRAATNYEITNNYKTGANCHTTTVP